LFRLDPTNNKIIVRLKMKSIGLMSGTSMDGIDAALLETDGTPELLIEIDDFSLSYHPLFKILLKSVEFGIRKYNGDLEKAETNFVKDLKEFLESEFKLKESKSNEKDEVIETKIKELRKYLNPNEQKGNQNGGVILIFLKK